MQETGNNSRLSVQVGLNGFSIDNGCARSGWLGADRIFTMPEFQARYDEVDISVFTRKFTLVPENFFRPESARELLSGVVTLGEDDSVAYAAMPKFGAVAVYSTSEGGSLARVIGEMVRRTDGSRGLVLPEQCFLLNTMDGISEYNKVVASYVDGVLYLAVAQGRSLLLCNCFDAPDFTTAEYFIFMAMRKFQLNPEVSTIFFRTPLSEQDEVSLYGYFRSVEQI